MCRHRHVTLHMPTKFCSNRSIGGRVMTSYPFFISRWRPAAIFHLIWVILDHPRCTIVSISLVVKFGLDPIYSFEDMAIFIFIFRRFWLEIAYPGHFLEVFGGIFSPKYGSHRSNPKKNHPCAETRRLSHKA